MLLYISPDPLSQSNPTPIFIFACQSQAELHSLTLILANFSTLRKKKICVSLTCNDEFDKPRLNSMEECAVRAEMTHMLLLPHMSAKQSCCPHLRMCVNILIYMWVPHGNKTQCC